MAVVSFEKKHDGRGVSMQPSGAWEARDRWQLIYDAEEPDPLAFRGSVLLPAVGEAHPDNADLILRGVSGQPAIDGSLKAWNFDLTWSTIALEADRHDPQRYDDSTRATKVWTHRAVQEPVEEAYVSDDGGTTFSVSKGPVANTVGDVFVPGITRTKYLPVCSYSRNQLTVAAATLKLPGYVNNDSFTLDGISITAGQAMILAADVSAIKRDAVYEFRTVDFQIIIREEGWDDKILNRGFYVLVSVPIVGIGTISVRQRALVRNGGTDAGDEREWVEPTDPVTLDANSLNQEMYQQLNPSDPSGFTPHWRFFRHLNFTSFSSFGFT